MQTNSEFITRVPVYIVGLEDQDIESSMAISKFMRSVESLSHHYPDISEARATVKSFSHEKGRKHFEVHVFVGMPKHQIEFREEGWSIESFSKMSGRKSRGS